MHGPQIQGPEGGGLDEGSGSYTIFFHDPNGMQVELTTSVPESDELMAQSARTAHADLAQWLKEEDVASNNTHRGQGWVPA